MVSILLSFGIMTGGVIAAFIGLRDPNHFPIRTVEIRDELKRIGEPQIAEAIAPYLDKGFFGLNVGGVQQNIMNLPWVASASVKRIWPDKLLVSIQEQTPQARFGEDGILNTEGVVFYPGKEFIPRNLPHFKGPSERAKEMLQQYHMILEALGPVGLSIAELELAPNGVLRVSLGNGIAIVLGKAEYNERLARFVLAYQSTLHSLLPKIAYVDLQYTNGLAIGWKEL